MPATGWSSIATGELEISMLAETAVTGVAMTTLTPRLDVETVSLALNYLRPTRPQAGNLLLARASSTPADGMSSWNIRNPRPSLRVADAYRIQAPSLGLGYDHAAQDLRRGSHHGKLVHAAKLKDTYRRWDRSKGKDTSMWTGSSPDVLTVPSRRHTGSRNRRTAVPRRTLLDTSRD